MSTSTTYSTVGGHAALPLLRRSPQSSVSISMLAVKVGDRKRLQKEWDLSPCSVSGQRPAGPAGSAARDGADQARVLRRARKPGSAHVPEQQL